MSSDENKSIDEILKEFQKTRESSNRPKKEIIDFAKPSEPLEPPKRSISQTEAPVEKAPVEKEEKPHREKRDNKERVKKEKIKKEKAPMSPKLKRALIILAAAVAVIALIIGAAAGIRHAAKSSETAYLKPYQERYPNVKFPAGILEEYCDSYGKDSKIKGVLKIGDINLDATVSYDEKKSPYLKKPREGATIDNYVIYLDSKKLENYYSTADAYNKSSDIIEYSNLFENYSYRVIGAYYTNTVEHYDKGYIFPYSATEKQTNKSKSIFVERLSTRFLYDTGVTMTTGDELISIVCPTDFHKDFKFVVVGVMRDKNTEKWIAEEKSKIHYPNIIFYEKHEDNPYALAGPWYPEIIVANGTVQQTIDDYK